MFSSSILFLMKNKYQTTIRTLLLVVISSGIFISCFHSHSNFNWHQTENTSASCLHFSVDTHLCPVCNFRLDGPTVDSVAPIAIQTIIAVLHDAANSVADELFTGELTGRAPPTLS